MKVLGVYNLSYNKSGVTMFFVLMFMIIASLLGSSLMFLSTKQSEMGGDYYAKKTAENAAESALDWFEGAIEDYTFDNTENMQSVLDWIENFDNNSNENRWFSASTTGEQTEFKEDNISSSFGKSTEEDATYIKINGERVKAKIRIENVDPYNNVVTIRAIGYGKNDSRKTIRAIYKLNGSVTQYDTTKISESFLDHAYYTDSRVVTNGGVKMTITGNNVYVGEGSNFQDKIDIAGNLKVMGNMVIPGTGGGFVGGNLYVNGNFDNQGDVFTVGENNGEYCYIEGCYRSIGDRVNIYSEKTFVSSIYEHQNSTTKIEGALYIKEQSTGGQTINSKIIVTDGVYAGYEAIDTKLADNTQTGDDETVLLDSYGKHIDVKLGHDIASSDDIVDDDGNSEDGLKETTIDIDVDALSENASFSLGSIKECLRKDNNSYQDNDLKLTAERVNELYTQGYTTFDDITYQKNNTQIVGKRFPETGVIAGFEDNFKETNGVMTINFDNAYSNIASNFGGGELAPDVKVAVAVNANFNFGGQYFWSAPDPSSALGIFCNPYEEGKDKDIIGSFTDFISTDKIHGMFYSSVNKSSSTTNKPNQFDGAVIIKGEEVIYNTTGKALKVDYNDAIVRLFGGINGEDGSIYLDPETGSSKDVPQFEVNSKQAIGTNVIKPKLISRY